MPNLFFSCFQGQGLCVRSCPNRVAICRSGVSFLRWAPGPALIPETARSWSKHEGSLLRCNDLLWKLRSILQEDPALIFGRSSTVRQDPLLHLISTRKNRVRLLPSSFNSRSPSEFREICSALTGRSEKFCRSAECFQSSLRMNFPS